MSHDALDLIASGRNTPKISSKMRWDAFDAYSARNSACLLAGAVDRAPELFKPAGWQSASPEVGIRRCGGIRREGLS
jgi:hypothetical protein